MATSSPWIHSGCDNADKDNFRRYYDEDGKLIGFNCRICLREWVQERLLTENTDKGAKITIDSIDYYFKNRPAIDLKVFNECYVSVGPEDMNSAATLLTKGDHISYEWIVGYQHHAIVTKVDQNKGTIDLVHWQGFTCCTKSTIVTKTLYHAKRMLKMRARVTQDKDVLLTEKCKSFRKYTYQNMMVDDVILVIARAKALINENDYSLPINNCEHLSYFCRVGIFYSAQTPTVVSWASSLIKSAMPYSGKDEQVASVNELARGDHVVAYGWFLHPRCHMIVTEINGKDGTFKAIKFTYEAGVVEEEHRFKSPLYRVLYDNCFPVDEVIRRASKYRGPEEYNLMTFNCKHFAFLCKTGAFPSTP